MLKNKTVRKCVHCGDGIRVETERKKRKVFDSSKKIKNGVAGESVETFVFYKSQCCGEISFLHESIAENN